MGTCTMCAEKDTLFRSGWQPKGRRGAGQLVMVQVSLQTQSSCCHASTEGRAVMLHPVPQQSHGHNSCDGGTLSTQLWKRPKSRTCCH